MEDNLDNIESDKDKEEEETYYKCSECNEFHVIPSSDKERTCSTVHNPSVSNNSILDPTKKYCQSCIERGFQPPNPATREWQTDYFVCDDCLEPLINNMTMVPKLSVPEVTHRLNGKSPILDATYQIYNIPTELQFDRVDTVCRNYEKLFNFRAPSIVNRSLDEMTIELEAMKSTIFYIQYFGEPLEIEIKRLKEETRKAKQLTGVRDTAEAYVKDKGTKKTSKVKQTQVESLANKLGLTPEIVAAMAKTAREKEFKNLTGVCSKCGTAHKSDDCPEGIPQLVEPKKPTQPIASGNVVNVGNIVIPINDKRKELLEKLRAKQGK